jgi:plasmid stabilization system protein ParE
MLRLVGTGMGTLGLAGVLANQGMLQAGDAPVLTGATNPLAGKPSHFRARAKHVIHLFMNGGPSQVDTFDPKPALVTHHGKKPSEAGLKTERATGGLMMSPFKFAKCGQSGIEVSEIFPKIGECIDDICVIRSMHTNVPNHEPGLLMMTSGEMQPTRPSMGSWLLYGLGTENQNLPGFMVLCPGKPVVGPQLWSNSFLPGIYQGTHINNAKMDPKSVIANINNPYLTREAQREQLDLLRQINELHLQERSENALEARIQSLEMAFRMQVEAQEAFDLNRETTATRDLYGRGDFANACLVARRLVERGVRVVQVFYGDGQPWDDHADIKAHADKAKNTDQPVAALLKDLKTRGLLQDTLILWGGEFGRTPTSEGAKGRDHNNHGFSVWLAGGGVKGGMTYGATDEFGFAAQENKMHVHDLHATILHLMGIDHTKLTYRYGGRDFRLTDVYGDVAMDIIA